MKRDDSWAFSKKISLPTNVRIIIYKWNIFVDLYNNARIFKKGRFDRNKQWHRTAEFNLTITFPEGKRLIKFFILGVTSIILIWFATMFDHWSDFCSQEESNNLQSQWLPLVGEHRGDRESGE